MSWLRELFAEQSSPVEVLVFIVAVVLICFAVAVGLYLILMSGVWAARLREEVPYRRVFLPSAKQFRRNSSEYLLALTTSILLTATLVVKHDLVEEVRNFSDLSSEEITQELEHVMPLETLPANVDLGAQKTWQVLKPLIDTGRNEQIREVLVRILEQQPGHLMARLPVVLMAAAVLLLLLYVLRLSWQRTHQLQEKKAGLAAPVYGETTRRLLVLAVCIALLLAQASLLGNSEALAEAALRSIRAMDPPPGDTQSTRVIGERIDGALTVQREILKIMVPEDNEMPDNVWTELTRLRAELATESGRLEELIRVRTEALSAEAETRIAALEASLGPLGDDLAAVEESLGGFESELVAFENRFQGVEAALGPLGDGVSALQETLAGFGSQLPGLEERLASLEARSDALAEEARTCCNDIGRQAESLANRHQEDFAGLQGDFGEIGPQLAGLVAGSRQFETDLGFLGTRFGGLQEQVGGAVTELRNTVEGTASQIEANRRTAEDLRSGLTRLSATLRETQQRLSEIDAAGSLTDTELCAKLGRLGRECIGGTVPPTQDSRFPGNGEQTVTAQGQPDLLPKPDDFGFCVREGGGLVITVANEGSGRASESVTIVDFGRHGREFVTTPAIEAGRRRKVLVEIPSGCFDSDCEFGIAVDGRQAVSEVNEANNRGDGNCIG